MKILSECGRETLSAAALDKRFFYLTSQICIMLSSLHMFLTLHKSLIIWIQLSTLNLNNNNAYSPFMSEHEFFINSH